MVPSLLEVKVARAEQIARDRQPLAVCRPLLPDADSLIPYLRTIDRARWYSNFGPLEQRLETRLARHFDVPADAVACVASGTQALTLALRAQDAPAGSLCMTPSWTFAATPAAILDAGLTPWFVDVDPHSWSLTPEAARALLAQAPGPVGAVVAVAPFGAPLDSAAWDRFAKDTGLAVVLDCAAGFDTARITKTPSIISLHATKVLGAGEGGLVASTDRRIAERVRQLSNFGFAGDRKARVAGVNAKMSEYTAAVGHAALDLWPGRRAAYRELTELYGTGLSKVAGLEPAPGLGAHGVVSVCCIELAHASAETVIDELAGADIEARQWWQQGCHAQPAFADFPRAPLPETERLATRVLGLPFYIGMTGTDIQRVCTALDQILAAR